MTQTYLKIAFRNLVRNKVYSFINILGLSLGIAGSIVIFQFVKYHLDTDTYHAKSKNIYRVVMDLHLDDGSIEHEKGSPFMLHNTLKNDFVEVENSAYLGQQEVTISVQNTKGTVDKYLEKQTAAFINPDYFNVFDYQWLVGNAALMNVPNSVVLTERAAKKYFGSVNPINKILKINNLQSVKVVGLLKDYSENTDLKTEVFVSLPTIKVIFPDYGYEEWSWFIKSRETYISLKDGVSKQRFEAQIPAFSKKYYGEMAKYYQFHLQELSDVHFGLDYGGKIKKSTLLTLSLIGILLVVIACINFINLSTARSFKRFKEIGVRKSLGSTQTQLFWQFLTEIIIISLLSILIGLIVSYLAVPTLNNWLKIQLTSTQFFDTKLLIFLPILTVCIIILAGFYPSFFVIRFNPIKALRGINEGTKNGISIRKGLVVTQFCISFVLIVAAILVVLQLDFIEKKDIGSSKDLILQVNLPSNEKSSLTTLKNQLAQRPFVKNLSFTRSAPSSKGGWGGSVKFENREWEKFVARSRVGDENYLDTYQIKLVTGRKPTASDTIKEVLINQKLVKDLGLKSPQEALDKRLFIGDGNNKEGQIVGVVADFNNTDLYSGIEPTVIFSAQNRYKQLAIKLNKFDSDKTIAQIKKTWERVFPDDVFEYSFYDQELAAFYEKEKLMQSLSISFALLSIFIACLGLFGLATFTVESRTKEIGIRKVLGASVANLTALLSKDFLKLVSIAVVVGSPIAYFLMDKWLQDFAFRILISGWVFVSSAVLLIIISLLTVSYQAVKAAMANPVKSLRTE